MATMAEIMVKISGENKDAITKINEVQQKLDKSVGKVRLDADTSPAMNKIKSVKDKLDELSDKGLGGSKVALGMLGATSAAMSGLGVAAVKAAGDLEMTKVAFTTMLHSGEAATAMIKDLQEFAAHTPFEFNQVKGATQKLLAFGFSAQSVIPTLTAVGNAASGLGLGAEGIDRITMALGQMSAKGKATGEDLKQLQEAGVQVWKYLSEKLGVSQKEAMDMVSKGGVDARTALQGIIGGMNQDFDGMMDKQSQTVLGLWSSIQDNLGQSMQAVGGSLIEGLNIVPMLNNIVDTLDEFTREVQTNGLSEALKKLIPPEFAVSIFAVSGAITAAAIPALYNLAAAAWAATVPLLPLLAIGAAIGAALYTVWKYGAPLKSMFSSLVGPSSTLNELWTNLVSICRNVASAILNTAPACKMLIVVILTLIVVFFKVQVAIASKVTGAFLYLLNILSVVVNWIISKMAEFAGYIGEKTSIVAGWFSWLGDAINQWSGGALDDIISFVKSAMSWLDDVIGKIKQFLGLLGQAKSESGEASSSDESQSGDTTSTKTPSYNEFSGSYSGDSGGGSGGGGGGGGGGQSEAEKLADKAKQLSESIADEWYNTFATKEQLADRWYSKEMEELESSRSANENYEQDKLRVTELYAQKRLQALTEEANRALDLKEKVRNMASEHTANTDMKGMSAGDTLFADLANKNEEAIAAIQDKYKRASLEYQAMTKQEQEVFRQALNERGVAYELDANNRISFEKMANEEVLAQQEEYYKQLEVMKRNYKGLEADINKAFDEQDLQALQEKLTTENIMHLQELENRKALMQSYYDAQMESYFNMQGLMQELVNKGTEALGNSISGLIQGTMTLKEAFQNVGKALLQTIADSIGQYIAAKLRASLLDKMIGKERAAQEKMEAAQSMATATAQIPVFAQLALLKSMSTGGLSAELGAAAFNASMAVGRIGILGLASGGVVDSATLAVIGEGRDKEAVVPLNEHVFNEIGEGISKSNGGGGTIVMNVQAMDASSFDTWIRNQGGSVIRDYFGSLHREFKLQGGY